MLALSASLVFAFNHRGDHPFRLRIAPFRMSYRMSMSLIRGSECAVNRKLCTANLVFGCKLLTLLGTLHRCVCCVSIVCMGGSFTVRLGETWLLHRTVDCVNAHVLLRSTIGLSSRQPLCNMYALFARVDTWRILPCIRREFRNINYPAISAAFAMI